MRFEGMSGRAYAVGRVLGKGGEGQVYELPQEPGLVLKQYNEPMSAARLSKLCYMVRIRTPQIETYAAWPVDVVSDSTGRPCGFVMRKLSNYLPLHMLFSPMDRKRLFPDKGYNFLVHVARNLAIAFHKIHEAGLVIGDVNEGNVLINESGMIALIDCDSFQVHEQGRYHYCEVGVPRYTAPELLRRGTFEEVVRTTNTDGFSLAVLLFQLLFLGRHPFAGKNHTREDLDEEQAIRKRLFAYSLRSRQKQLTPPDDSFDIGWLPPAVSDLFHLAFEQEAARPDAEAWVKVLDGLLKHLQTCPVSKLHVYPAGMAACPWCLFRARRGLLYFAEDGARQAFTGDPESFVHGFRVEALAFRGISRGYVNPALKPRLIDRKYYRSKHRKTWRLFLLILLGMAGSYVNLWVLPFAALFILLFRWKWHSRLVRTERRQRKLHFEALKAQYQEAIRQYNGYEPLIDKYNKELARYNRLLADYRDLPALYQQRKRQLETRIYEKHLQDFLSRYLIREHTIPAVGAAKKILLARGGIRTAADISRLGTVKVIGIGPAYRQRLLAWQQEIAARFQYTPPPAELAGGIAVIHKELDTLKGQLDAAIRKGFQALNQQHSALQAQGAVLLQQVASLGDQLYQAELDMQFFRQRIL